MAINWSESICMLLFLETVHNDVEKQKHFIFLCCIALGQGSLKRVYKFTASISGCIKVLTFFIPGG